MSRKDYVELADHLGLALRFADDDERKGLQAAVGHVASALKALNARFDADKFSAHVDKVTAHGLKG